MYRSNYLELIYHFSYSVFDELRFSKIYFKMKFGKCQRILFESFNNYVVC